MPLPGHGLLIEHPEPFIHSLFLSFLPSVSFYYFVALNVFQRRTIHTNSQRVLEVGFLPKKKKKKLV